MQNRSKAILEGKFDPVFLDPEFPITTPILRARRDDPPPKPHVHECFEIGYCYEGSGVFIVENKTFTYQGGDAIVVNHRELHLAASSPNITSKWCFINLDPAGLLAGFVPIEERFLETETLSGRHFVNLIKGKKYPELCSTVRELMEDLMEKKEGYRSTVRALVWLLMVRLHQFFPAQNTEEDEKPLSRKDLIRIRPALEHIAGNYHKTVTIEKIAELCHISTPHFRRLFNASTGISPLEYLVQFRLKAATVLLKNTKRSILEISLETGFPTLSNFNRQFKRTYNIAPRKWRHEQK
ncbi:MAG: hypothetical protein A2017_12385 [Lentisphaerae bacterium GWF2_44_16]|nr:MAG: hypothetical protein A2017_12385 [Lentisphaerae bacterium GWF2_44_16]